MGENLTLIKCKTDVPWFQVGCTNPLEKLEKLAFYGKGEENVVPEFLRRG